MELVMVLVVLGVVLAIAAPIFSGFIAGRQAPDAAQAVLGLTRWSHSQAVSQGQLCRLNVDARAGAFWITVQQGGSFVEPDNDNHRFTAPEGVSVSMQSSAKPPQTYVQFYPSGRNDVATIEIRGRNGQEYDVTCLSATEAFVITSPTGGQ